MINNTYVYKMREKKSVFIIFLFLCPCIIWIKSWYGIFIIILQKSLMHSGTVETYYKVK